MEHEEALEDSIQNHQNKTDHKSMIQANQNTGFVKNNLDSIPKGIIDNSNQQAQKLFPIESKLKGDLHQPSELDQFLTPLPGKSIPVQKSPLISQANVVGQAKIVSPALDYSADPSPLDQKTKKTTGQL